MNINNTNFIETNLDIPKFNYFKPTFTDRIRQILGIDISWNKNAEKKRPIYDWDLDLLISIWSNESYISNADTNTPVLCTLWLWPCVWISWYDKNKKIWFLAHIVNERDVNILLWKTFQRLQEFYWELDLEFWMVWWMKWRSEWTIREILIFIKKYYEVPKIVHEDLLWPNHLLYLWKSLLLDTRNWIFYSFPWPLEKKSPKDIIKI